LLLVQIKIYPQVDAVVALSPCTQLTQLALTAGFSAYNTCTFPSSSWTEPALERLGSLASLPSLQNLCFDWPLAEVPAAVSCLTQLKGIKLVCHPYLNRHSGYAPLLSLPQLWRVWVREIKLYELPPSHAALPARWESF